MFNSDLDSEPISEPNNDQPDLAGPESPHFQLPTGAEKEGGWEEVAEGRFMPRRIRGSCHGRALG
ncbi:MAG: hypothetical protein WBD20_12375 [Pirellulaceae bacterium]